MAAVPSPCQPWIKVCGVRNEGDLEACAAAGATHVGINTWPGSVRCVSPAVARELATCARRLGLSPVLLHVEGSSLSMRDALCLKPDYLQTRVKPPRDLSAELSAAGVGLIESRPASDPELLAPSWGQVLLLDTPSVSAEGGTGRTFDWSLSRSAPRPFVMAGGLGPDNVAEAIAAATPQGVDAASRLECSPGIKDPALIRDFCQAARRAFTEIHHEL
jgi:phosphoribosylanthranilate isomerase